CSVKGVIGQPCSGYYPVRETGATFADSWVAVSVALYLVAGAFWLPVVGMQRRMRDLGLGAAASGAPLPPAYHRLFRLWFLFGFPGFGSVLAIIVLMVAKPVLY